MKLSNCRKCQWCGEYFTVERKRKFNAVKYCSKNCRIEARREKNRESNRRYRKLIAKEENRGYLLGESQINEHPSPNFEKEYHIIRKEKRRIGI